MSTILAVTEVAKLMLNGYFAYAKQQGISEEDALKLYEESKAEFNSNNPDDLADV